MHTSCPLPQFFLYLNLKLMSYLEDDLGVPESLNLSSQCGHFLLNLFSLLFITHVFNWSLGTGGQAYSS
jgi:hypothetical protein